MSESRSILYIGGRLPTLSETFVTRELLGLRERGLIVHAASVRASERGLGDHRLDTLATEAVPVYGRGAARLLADAAAEVAAHPARGVRTMAMMIADAVTGRDVAMKSRPKVVWQGLAGLALARRVRPRGVGHVHAHMAHVPAAVAMYAASQLGVPFSFTGHAADLFRDRALLTRKLRRAAFVACISEWHRAFYLEQTPLDEDKLPIVRCGVEPDSTAAGPASGDGRTVLSVARLVPKKGIDVLLRAVGQLGAMGAPLTCQIVGDGPERSRLESLCAGLDLGERVALLGARPNEQVRALMRSCDLFVLPCRVGADGDRDGIPVVLMEAMAAGVCVISGDLPTIRELVIPDRTGVLVPPGDADALAAVIRDLLARPERRRAIAEAGRRYVLEEFSLERNLDRLQRAFARAAAGHRSSQLRAGPAPANAEAGNIRQASL